MKASRIASLRADREVQLEKEYHQRGQREQKQRQAANAARDGITWFDGAFGSAPAHGSLPPPPPVSFAVNPCGKLLVFALPA